MTKMLRFSKKYLMLSCVFLVFSSAHPAFALFGSRPNWDIDSDASTTMLDQVNKKISKKSNWFKKSHYPGPLDVRIVQEPIPKELVEYLNRNISFINSSPLSDYLQNVIKKLSIGWAGAEIPVSVLIEANRNMILKVDKENQIIISTAYLEKVASEDELAFLLAHELAHIILLDNQSKQIYLQKIPSLIEKIEEAAYLNENIKAIEDKKKDDNAMDELATHTAMTGWLWSDLMTPVWSRTIEQQADYLAIDLLREGGYNLGKVQDALKLVKEADEMLSERMEVIKSTLLNQYYGHFYTAIAP